jgi:hypothetical protein
MPCGAGEPGEDNAEQTERQRALREGDAARATLERSSASVTGIRVVTLPNSHPKVFTSRPSTTSRQATPARKVVIRRKTHHRRTNCCPIVRV